jgi:hypothetical protein
MTDATTSSVPTKNFVWSEPKWPVLGMGAAVGRPGPAGTRDRGEAARSVVTLSSGRGLDGEGSTSLK